MVDFVQTTRRWYDRGNPRDAGDLDACQSPSYKRGGGDIRLDIVKLNDGRHALFRNIERIDEALIYNKAFDRIKNSTNAKHIEDIFGPSEDVSVWDLDGTKVQLVLDINYGTKISADTEAALDALIKLIRD